MKQLLIGLPLAMLLCPFSISAATIDFEDTLIFGDDGQTIFEGSPISYTHDLTNQFDFSSGNPITSASLQLTFEDDGDYFREDLFFKFDEGQWSYFGEIDSDSYTIGVDSMLLSDGSLEVSLGLREHGWLTQDVNLMESTLSGQAAVVPLPAAAWLFGSALVGMAGIGRMRMRQT